MFIVSCEAVPEAEWWAMLPAGVSVHAARIDASAPWATWRGDKHNEVILTDDLRRGAGQFANMRLDAVVVGHSSSSLIGGPGWDAAVVQELHEILPADLNVTTNGLDCLAALKASGMVRPFIVFPPWFNDRLIEEGAIYFASNGFTPADVLKADPGQRWQGVSPAELYPRGMGFEQDVEYLYNQIGVAISAAADGVLIAGTGFRSVGIIEALEAALGRPVVTANQASMWRCLRMAGVNDVMSGYGKLLEYV